jgi:RHS repeat-associated protein
MLTRTDSDGTTRFEWDGFDCIRELAPPTGSAVFDTAQFDTAEFGSSGRTDYYVVNGHQHQLVRDGAAYTVIIDALGSVRLVVDATGTTISTFDYGPWGQLLPSSVDSLPGGMPYAYVGAFGVRWDPNTGLRYMRNRWYEQKLQRFISRDPAGTRKLRSQPVNVYCYADALPTQLVDVTGTEAAPPPYSQGVYIGYRPMTGEAGMIGYHNFIVVDGHSYELLMDGRVHVDEEQYSGPGIHIVHQNDQGLICSEVCLKNAIQDKITHPPGYSLLGGHCFNFVDALLIKCCAQFRQ